MSHSVYCQPLSHGSSSLEAFCNRWYAGCVLWHRVDDHTPGTWSQSVLLNICTTLVDGPASRLMVSMETCGCCKRYRWWCICKYVSIREPFSYNELPALRHNFPPTVMSRSKWWREPFFLSHPLTPGSCRCFQRGSCYLLFSSRLWFGDTTPGSYLEQKLVFLLYVSQACSQVTLLLYTRVASHMSCLLTRDLHGVYLSTHNSKLSWPWRILHLFHYLFCHSYKGQLLSFQIFLSLRIESSWKKKRVQNIYSSFAFPNT